MHIRFREQICVLVNKCQSPAAECEHEKELTIVALYSICGQWQLRPATVQAKNHTIPNLISYPQIYPVDLKLLFLDNRKKKTTLYAIKFQLEGEHNSADAHRVCFPIQLGCSQISTPLSIPTYKSTAKLHVFTWSDTLNAPAVWSYNLLTAKQAWEKCPCKEALRDNSHDKLFS